MLGAVCRVELVASGQRDSEVERRADLRHRHIVPRIWHTSAAAIIHVQGEDFLRCSVTARRAKPQGDGRDRQPIP